MRCLNLKITYECTNDCSFCFSSHLKNSIIPLESLLNALTEGFENGCRELVISGGEPTLFPDKIKKILNTADALGYEKFIIQTNGSGLSENVGLVEFLNDFGLKKDVNVSFSIHGHTEIIHDKMTSQTGSFNKLIKAMDNISRTTCGMYTNTVISTLNINCLDKIAVYLKKKYLIKIMQFSVMHLEYPSALSVDMSSMVQAIKKLSKLIDKSVLRTEGIPFCMMYGIEECVGESYWPNKLDLYNKKDDYMKDFDQVSYGMRKKQAICKDCIMDELCMGVWNEHGDEFMSMGIKPICI